MSKKIQPKQQNKDPNAWMGKHKKILPYILNKSSNFLMFFVACFIVGGTNHFIMFHQFVPTFFFLDFFIILLFASPIFFFRTTMFDRIYLPILLFFVVIFYTLNSCYHDYFGTVFCLKDIPNALKNLTQVTTHGGELPIKWIIINIVLWVVFVAPILLFNIKFRFETPINKTNKTFYNRTKLFAGLFMVSSLIVYEFSLGMVTVGENAANHKSINYVNYTSEYYFNKLGMASYYTKELRQIIFDHGASFDEIKSYLQGAKIKSNDFTNWFAENDSPNPNIFVIMIETGDQVMLNPTLTPRLYSLLNDGINCNHNFSNNTTNVSDINGINGGHPPIELSASKKYSVPFNLPNLLNEKYETYFYSDIDKSEDGYRTIDLMPNLGFEHCYFHDHILPGKDPWKYMWVNYTRDSEVMDGILKDVKSFPTKHGDKPFYIQFPTMFMHENQIRTPQNKAIIDSIEKDFGDKVREAERNGQWNNPFTNSVDKDRFWIYTLKTMDFDRALGNLMDTLYGDAAPEYLKNSLLVVYGDHYWYEKTTKHHQFAAEIKQIYDDQDINKYSTIMGMYHPLLNNAYATYYGKHAVDKVTTTTSIVPTILDLLGIKYNPRLYQSLSIFDEDSNLDVVYSNSLKYFMNEHYTSDNGVTISKIFNDNNTKRQFQEKTQEALHQLRILNGIYSRNIFRNHSLDEFMPQENNLSYLRHYYINSKKLILKQTSNKEL